MPPERLHRLLAAHRRPLGHVGASAAHLAKSILSANDGSGRMRPHVHDHHAGAGHPARTLIAAPPAMKLATICGVTS